jgi:hypothetical protein
MSLWELKVYGWEDSSALEFIKKFTQEADVNGIVWERFSAQFF